MTSIALSPSEARAILGLGGRADASEVASAFRAAAKRFHPDRPGGEVRRFSLAVEAYRRLTETARTDESVTRRRLRRFAEAWTPTAL